LFGVIYLDSKSLGRAYNTIRVYYYMFFSYNERCLSIHPRTGWVIQYPLWTSRSAPSLGIAHLPICSNLTFLFLGLFSIEFVLQGRLFHFPKHVILYCITAILKPANFGGLLHTSWIPALPLIPDPKNIHVSPRVLVPIHQAFCIPACPTNAKLVDFSHTGTFGGTHTGYRYPFCHIVTWQVEFQGIGCLVVWTISHQRRARVSSRQYCHLLGPQTK
jgi:hypothetical protein